MTVLFSLGVEEMKNVLVQDSSTFCEFVGLKCNPCGMRSLVVLKFVFYYVLFGGREFGLVFYWCRGEKEYKGRVDVLTGFSYCIGQSGLIEAGVVVFKDVCDFVRGERGVFDRNL